MLKVAELFNKQLTWAQMADCLSREVEEALFVGLLNSLSSMLAYSLVSILPFESAERGNRCDVRAK